MEVELKKLLFLLLLFVGHFTQSLGESAEVVRFHNPTEEMIAYFNDNGYDIAACVPGKYLDIVGNRAFLEEYQSRGYNVSIPFSMASQFENLHARGEHDGYRSYDEMLEELQEIVKKYPEICKLYDVGDSRAKEYATGPYVQFGHDIWALKISGNVAVEEDEPAVCYWGAHHAREPISTEVVMAIIHHILNNYGKDEKITNSVENTAIWFVPMVNPDGHEFVFRGNRDRMWRKNLRDNNNNQRIDDAGMGNTPDGVDPNRNYSWQWGGQGASSSSNSATYRGPSAASEPEIKAMEAMMRKYKFYGGMTYHSYSQLVLWPYGYGRVKAPDNAALKDLGEKMAAPMNYNPKQSVELYPASGVTDDFAYGECGIFCYTIELGTQFIPPQSQIKGICDKNIPAAMLMLDRINHSALRGHVKDRSTGKPIHAEVIVDKIDVNNPLNPAKRMPYTSNHKYGAYARLLMPGQYSVTFKAPNYFDTTVTVNITDKEPTFQEILLRSTIVSTANDHIVQSMNSRVTVNFSGHEGVVLNLNGFSHDVSAFLFTSNGKRLAIATGKSFSKRISLYNKKLPKGVYIVNLTSGNASIKKRFVVQ